MAALFQKTMAMLLAGAASLPAARAEDGHPKGIAVRHAAGDEAPLEHLPRAPERRGLALWVEGGLGAVLPIPAGGGAGIKLVEERGLASAGVFGHCTGATTGQNESLAAGQPALQRKSGYLCGAGLLAGLHGSAKGVAPAIAVGFGWGWLALTDHSLAPRGAFRARGALLSAQVGGRIATRYEVMLRADVPMFRAAHADADAPYSMAVVGEFAIRLF